MRTLIENCTVEIQVERGVIYVHHPSGGHTVLRISGLTPEQCRCEQIDVKALQPRSHNETLYGFAEGNDPLPDYLKK